jgi:ABC-type multidrug transport system fused ATPase/permease subunit
MEPSIYRYILKHTYRDQIFLIVLTAASLPFVYATLEVPKRIINQALSTDGGPYSILGIDLGQIQFLLALCFMYLGLVILNGVFKYVISVYEGLVGERLLRRLRYELYTRLLRFPLPHFKRTSQGELIPLVVSETEPLGEFIGYSFSLPAFQAGNLLTYVSFIFVQDWLLGLAAISMYPLQMYVIPKVQRQVNRLAKERVATVRRFADRIGETVSGVTEIHAHDTSRYARAGVGALLGHIYNIRFELYKRKFFIKFLNNFLDKIGPFFFYSMGGYLVIQGELSLGALVASLSAYKDISAPWKELLKYYQTKEDIKVKYTTIIEQFQPAGMLDEEVLDREPERIEPLEGQLVASGVTYREDEGTTLVEGLGFSTALDQHVIAVGLGNSGKTELGMLLARLLPPTQGRIRINDTNLAEFPEAILGRRVSYVGADSHIFAGTVRDNAVYGLKHLPVHEPGYDEKQKQLRERDLARAIITGNSLHDYNADWIDYEAAGVHNAEALDEAILGCLDLVDMSEDLYQLGLRSILEPGTHQDIQERILEARMKLQARLTEPDFAGLVVPFDRETYNQSMSVSENLLFGTSGDPAFQSDDLAGNEDLRAVLTETGVLDDLVQAGRRVAELMVELFSDVDPDSELFEQYSFISAESLPEYRELLKHVEQRGLEALEDAERYRLVSLALLLISARHRLGVIDERMQSRLLEARKALVERWPAGEAPIEFFDLERFHSAISIQDNILFGRLVHGQARAHSKIGELISETVQQMGLREPIMRVGLDYSVGIGGSRLNSVQRQRLAIARCIIKNPDLLIINQAADSFDPDDELELLRRLGERFRERKRALIWITNRAQLAEHFDQVLVMHEGHLRETGKFQAVKDSADYQRLLN